MDNLYYRSEPKVPNMYGTVLYHHNNRQQAEEFRDYIDKEVTLPNEKKLYLFDEAELFAFSNRKITQLHYALGKSNIVFIYLTKEFVTDDWMNYSNEACLMTAILNPDKLWVVPVFTEEPDSTFEIPTCLTTLNGYHFYRKQRFDLNQVKHLIIEINSTKKDKLKSKETRWIPKMENTLSTSFRKINDELTDIQSTKEDTMCPSNKELNSVTNTTPNGQENSRRERTETELTKQQSSESSCDTTISIECDMAPTRHVDTDQKNGKEDVFDSKAGNIHNCTDEINPHSPSSQYSDQVADDLEPNINIVKKDQRGQGQKKEVMTTDNSLYQTLCLHSLGASDRSIVDGGESPTQRKKWNMNVELLPQLDILLKSEDIRSCSESGQQSKSCSYNFTEHMQPKTHTDVYQNEYVEKQGAIPSLRDFEIGTELKNTKSERNPCRQEPINGVYDSGKINRQAANCFHYHETVNNFTIHEARDIQIHEARNVQIGHHNTVQDVCANDDESKNNDKKSPPNQVPEEEMHPCDNRNGELSRKFEVVPSQDLSYIADDDHINSTKEIIFTLGNNDSEKDFAITKRMETCRLNDNAVKEDSGETDFTKENVRSRTCEYFGPEQLSKQPSGHEEVDTNDNARSLIKKTSVATHTNGNSDSVKESSSFVKSKWYIKAAKIGVCACVAVLAACGIVR